MKIFINGKRRRIRIASFFSGLLSQDGTVRGTQIRAFAMCLAIALLLLLLLNSGLLAPTSGKGGKAAASRIGDNDDTGDSEVALCGLNDEVAQMAFSETEDAFAPIASGDGADSAAGTGTGSAAAVSMATEASLATGDAAYDADEVLLSKTETLLSKTEIPYETEYHEDDTLFLDERIVQTEGKTGFVMITESREDISIGDAQVEAVTHIYTVNPVTEVVLVGTKLLTASRGFYIWPADGEILSRFGYRNATVGSTYHKGLDISGGASKSIYAADGGEVVFSGTDGAYGKVIRIKHDSGEVTAYAHCSSLLVKEGELVQQGQTIGYVGMTGLATGVHLHFEIIVDGTNINPLTRVKPPSNG